MPSTALRRLIIMALIVLWEVLPRIGAIPELFLPSLSSTLWPAGATPASTATP
jgi:NitT/TauT family transport system permease protein